MRDLVCLHAAASGPATWAPLRPALTELGFRLHTPLLLGHHDAERQRSYPLTSFRDDVLRSLAGLSRFTLVGHSLGAFVASMVAAAEPERVERLVLEEIPVPRRDTEDSRPSRRRAALLAFPGRKRCDPVMIKDVLAGLRAPQPEWWAGLAGISAPTLILAGGPRSHLDQSRYALLGRALRDSTTVTIGVGHRIHSRAPERWLSAVEPWLGEVQ
ncbi:alpha/beta fold hydrolase [Amycolatopsis sp. OK19-0408]|uniref:Alpha/beta fold hydrolase n=1 Tax=Amycolatopsis iheyensis TaxID=2945988 RepID=A0A9X2NHZ3_9PSEU|nr:alpha/beta hydrolase [Amycolatopsis iheyensis]MCR6487761.1 alpha/beta fold hydrolase [Amycolatopsis iheyensis]